MNGQIKMIFWKIECSKCNFNGEAVTAKFKPKDVVCPNCKSEKINLNEIKD